MQDCTYIDDHDELDPFIANEEILQYETTNPFFISMNGSSIKYTKTKFLADEYKNVYILCLDDDFEDTPQNRNKVKLFYQSDSEIEELRGQSKLVTLVQGPFALVQIQNIRAGIIPIGKDILEYFNHEYSLNSKELVYLMLETKEQSVKSWLKMYESEPNLDSFIHQKIFTSYYKLEGTMLENNLIDQLSKVGDFGYWRNEKNCLLSINSAFKNRKFNLTLCSKWNLPTAEIEKELKKLLCNFQENISTIKSNTTYPTEITNPMEKSEDKLEKSEDKLEKSDNNILKFKPYVDGSNRDNNSYYPITKTEELDFDVSIVEELLTSHSLNEKEKYYLLCNLISSKNYCHYVLGNKEILEKNKSIFNKYLPVFRYLIGYAWISLYMEESIRKTKITEADRFVFDLETAFHLPIFPHCIESPKLNPYFCQTVSDHLANMQYNINGVKQSAEYQNGIVDLAEFKQRLNIFISGKSDSNILEGIDWSNMVITGGTMAAIIPKSNPLMALFKKNPGPIKENELDRFFQEYYSDSDIDIACNHSNILDFIEHVIQIKKVIHSNLDQSIKESEIIITPVKSLATYVNSTILKNKCDSGEIPFKYDYIIANKNKRSVKFYFYELYLEQKRLSNQNNKKILGDKIDETEFYSIVEYCEFDKMVLIINDVSFESDAIENRKPETNSGLDTVYYIKDDKLSSTSNSESADNKNVFIKFSETLKYKIHSKHMKHPFEVFRINSQEFFSCIGRFHLPCVRSYYNGTTCLMLPSAITAYHTLTNIEFKYFAGSRDPISIIDKYRKRGYGTVLNKTEINQYLSYIMAIGNYREAYGVKNSKDIKSIIGSLDINHQFFKPRQYFPDDYAVNKNITLDYTAVKIDYVNDKKDLIKRYKDNYPNFSSELIEKTTIKETGEISSYQKWMLDASYDMLN